MTQHPYSDPRPQGRWCALELEIRADGTTLRCRSCGVWLWIRAPQGSGAFEAVSAAFQTGHPLPPALAPGLVFLGVTTSGAPVVVDSLGGTHTLADLQTTVVALEAQAAAWGRYGPPPPWMVDQLQDAIARRQVLIRLLTAFAPDEASR